MLYMYGGVDGAGNVTNDFHVFDPSKAAWQELSQSVSGSIPSQRAFSGFTAAGSKLFLFGGRESVNGPSLNSLHALDLMLMVWEDLSVLGSSVSARVLMGFSSVGEKLYVIGGLSDYGARYTDHVLGGVRILDPTARTSTDLSVFGLPPPRSAFGFGSTGGRLYMFGGMWADHKNWNGNQFYNDLFRYDPSTMAWQDLSLVQNSPPSPRFDMGFSASDGKLFVFGGKIADGSEGYVNDLHMFDEATLSWQELTYNMSTAPVKRVGPAFAAVGDKLFLFGGSVDVWRPDLYIDELHMFDLASMAWHSLNGVVSGQRPSGR
eukprot:1888613-Rhodomonas_salina.1